MLKPIKVSYLLDLLTTWQLVKNMNKTGFVDYIIDLLSSYGNITKRNMFGGCGLYQNKKIFAIIIDDELYFKADKLLAKEYEASGSHPFTYQRNDKIIAMSYWYVPVEIIEDNDLLKIWFNKSSKIDKFIGEK